MDCFGQSKQALTPKERAYIQKQQTTKTLKENHSRTIKKEPASYRSTKAKTADVPAQRLDRDAATGFKRTTKPVVTKPVESKVPQSQEQKVFDSLNQQLRYLKTISNPTQKQLTLIQNIEEQIQKMIPELEELDCNK